MKVLIGLLLVVAIVVAVNAVLQRNDLAQRKTNLSVMTGGMA